MKSNNSVCNIYGCLSNEIIVYFVANEVTIPLKISVSMCSYLLIQTGKGVSIQATSIREIGCCF